MSASLPINLDDLLYRRSVESERVEFKASWDPKTTGPRTLRTICAFANDYHNLNGGYIVIGVEERNGRAVLPPSGLSPRSVEASQRWLRGQCNRLDPVYQPVLSPETVDGRLILVIWAPASDTRPHRAPGSGGTGPNRYWVRLGSETVDAEQRGAMLGELLNQTARVPWDDRRALNARLEELSGSKVREHLHDVRSRLLDEPHIGEIYRRMRITARVNDHEVPRNCGLLFFSRDPSSRFRGARIEVVQFAADRAGDVQEERVFSGPLADQLRDCLGYLENLSVSHLKKQRTRIETEGWVSYPLPALRETLVNAIYHRGYDVDQPEPTKVYLYPDRIDIVSYPGPVPGIDSRHLAANARVPPAPARNRRIGEFLKELGLAEGRLSGLPKVYRAMEDNGSPEPHFEFDDERTYFRATLPAHPEYVALSALRDAAHLRALGQRQEAFRRLETAWEAGRGSAELAAEMVHLHARRGEIRQAEDVLREFEARGRESEAAYVANTFIEAMIGIGLTDKVACFLREDRFPMSGQNAIDAAVLALRTGDAWTAHRYFEMAGETVRSHPVALLDFVRTKIRLAQDARRQGRPEADRWILAEAGMLLERAAELDAAPERLAQAWRDIALALRQLEAPVSDIENAYRRAIELQPEEQEFVRELEETLAGIR